MGQPPRSLFHLTFTRKADLDSRANYNILASLDRSNKGISYLNTFASTQKTLKVTTCAQHQPWRLTEVSSGLQHSNKLRVTRQRCLLLKYLCSLRTPPSTQHQQRRLAETLGPTTTLQSA